MIRLRARWRPLTASGNFRRAYVCFELRPWCWPRTGFRWEEWDRTDDPRDRPPDFFDSFHHRYYRTARSEERRMRVFKVGSFYPYAIVAAESAEQAMEVMKAAGEMDERGWGWVGQMGVGDDMDGWVIEELGTTKPGIIDTNAG